MHGSLFAYSRFAYSRFAYFRSKSGVSPTRKKYYIWRQSNILKLVCTMTGFVCTRTGVHWGQANREYPVQINRNVEANRDRAAHVVTYEPANVCLSMCKLLNGSESMQTGLTSECTSYFRGAVLRGTKFWDSLCMSVVVKHFFIMQICL